MARVFYANRAFRRLSEKREEALLGQAADIVESGEPFVRTHRKRKSLTKTEKLTPLSEISRAPKPEQLEGENGMATYITYGAAQLRPFTGKSKDHPGIVDFLETIENQAAAECR